MNECYDYSDDPEGYRYTQSIEVYLHARHSIAHEIARHEDPLLTRRVGANGYAWMSEADGSSNRQDLAIKRPIPPQQPPCNYITWNGDHKCDEARYRIVHAGMLQDE
jgi:hypothetical protein